MEYTHAKCPFARYNLSIVGTWHCLKAVCDIGLVFSGMQTSTIFPVEHIYEAKGDPLHLLNKFIILSLLWQTDAKISPFQKIKSEKSDVPKMHGCQLSNDTNVMNCWSQWYFGPEMGIVSLNWNAHFGLTDLRKASLSFFVAPYISWKNIRGNVVRATVVLRCEFSLVLLKKHWVNLIVFTRHILKLCLSKVWLKGVIFYPFYTFLEVELSGGCVCLWE